MLDQLKNTYLLLNKPSRVFKMFGLFFLNSFFELIGVSVLAYYLVLLTGEKPSQTLLDFDFIQSANFFDLTLWVAAIFLFKGIFSYLISVWIANVAVITQKELTLELFLKTVYGSTTNHKNREVSKVINYLSNYTSSFAQGVVPAFLTLFAEALTAITLISVLLYQEPQVTVILIILFCLIAAAYDLIMKNLLIKLGAQENLAMNKVILIIKQSVRSYREISLLDRESFFIEKLTTSLGALVDATRGKNRISLAPRYIYEVFIIFVLTGIVAAHQWTGGVGNIFPTLSLFAAVSFRLMPSVMKITRSVNVFRSSHEVIKQLLHEHKIQYVNKRRLAEVRKLKDISIEIENLYFSYPSGEELFGGLSISIPANAITGISGKSGSGKSTLISLLLQFLQPDRGTLKYMQGKRLVSFDQIRNSAALIPQQVELFQASVKENVSLTTTWVSENNDRFDLALKRAGIDFIQNGDEIIDEDGDNFSGGQKQRIAISRAMYHGRSLIFMDEITSALDSKTTIKIMEHIKMLSKDSTIVLVSHDEYCLSMCDKVIHL